VILKERTCAIYRGSVPALSQDAIQHYLPQVPGWEYQEKKIARTFVLGSFHDAVAFLNKIARIAEVEGHHPDMGLVNHRRVAIFLRTRKARGLTENDFIMPAKINALVQ